MNFSTVNNKRSEHINYKIKCKYYSNSLTNHFFYFHLRN